MIDFQQYCNFAPGKTNITKAPHNWKIQSRLLNYWMAEASTMPFLQVLSAFSKTRDFLIK